LLVSVQNCEEAKLARKVGVDWIDLKNPAGGPLGAPHLDMALRVSQSLSGFSNTSVAAGELVVHGTEELVTHLSQWFPYIKVGLSHCADNGCWQMQLISLSRSAERFGAKIIPVIYADYLECQAPPPCDVLQLADRLSAPYVLIDTYHKDGRRLLDCTTLDALQEHLAQCERIGCRLVLAGSLALSDLPQLSRLPVEAIGVRGAVCSTERDSQICERKLREWVELFTSP
jgi:uncharacterized protein (UPF0264 family)